MDNSRQQQQIQQILQQALASSTVSATHNQLSPANSSVLGGMMVLPSSVASTYLPNQLRGSPVTNSSVLQPFVIRHGTASSVAPVHEAGSQLAARSAVSPLSPRAIGSATVHHHGSSDTKESPFVHLRGHLQTVKSLESVKLTSGLEAGRRPSADSMENEKPLQKRIKLETPDDETKYYQKLYIESLERDLTEIRASYQDHMTELFFLENNGNLMDYLVWSKRPNVHLNRLLQAESLDSEIECAGEEEKRINNEVKVLTTIGSSIPIATPIAIATTLPPAITALQQQESASGLSLPRKAGGRHGMVFGYVPPKSNQLHPLVPGGTPLSPKAATTTVGSPPPYVLACPTTLPMPVSTTTDPSTASVTVSTYGSQPDELVGILTGSSVCESGSLSGSTDGFVCSLPATVCSATVSVNSAIVSSTVVPTVLSTDLTANGAGSQLVIQSSHDAIMDQAKQEAQVMQRIGDLRRQGMWSARRLPKIQEYPRCKSHWDYVLEEMQWLAVDFAQERRWKMAVARKLANDVVRFHVTLAEKQKQKAIHTAGLIAGMVRDFWMQMAEMAYCKRQMKTEEKRNKLLEYIAHNLIASSSVYDLDVSGLDHCYSTVGEQVVNREKDYQDEIDDLIREAEMPLQDLVDKYAAAYDVDFKLPSSPESMSSTDSTSSFDGDSDFGDACPAVSSSEWDEMNDQELVAVVCDLGEITAAAQKVRPLENSNQTVIQQSPLVQLQLRDYQLQAVEWMAKISRSGIGCILSDEAGLGKKVQTIAFLAYLADRGLWGPHLVVVPNCYLMAWEMEFDRCYPACRTVLFYGEFGHRRKLKKGYEDSAAGTHVFVTSYQILSEDLQFFKNTEWKYLILDDADDAVESDVMSSVLSLNTCRNILLTNTDVTGQFRISISSVAQLLMSKPSRADLSCQLESCSSSDLNQLIGTLSLRRTYDDVREQLPQINEAVVSCTLSNRQRLIYAGLIDKHSCASASHHTTDALELIVLLQKLLNHPDLAWQRPERSSLFMDPIEYRTSAVVTRAVVHDVWQKVEAAGETPSVCEAAGESSVQSDADLFEDFELIMAATKRAESCETPSTNVLAERISTVLYPDHFFRAVYPHNVCFKLKRNMFGRLSWSEHSISSTKWKSLGYNLCQTAVMDLACDINSPTESLKKLVYLQSDFEKEVMSSLNWLQCVVRPVLANTACMITADSSASEDSSNDPLLTKLYCVFNDYLPSIHNTAGLPLLSGSGKLRELNRLIADLTAQSKRVVIMTQMTCMLDILELFMDSNRYRYMRLDPAVEVAQRRRIVQQFNADRRIQCLLMLSRTPVLGLDLPVADAIIFYDYDIRPSAHEHAEKFCRRMGLLRDLKIFRLKTTDTIEENLLNAHDRHLLRGGPQFELLSLSEVTIYDLFKNTLCGEKLEQLESKLTCTDDTDEHESNGNTLISVLDNVEDSDDVKAAELINAERRMLSEPMAADDQPHRDLALRRKRRRRRSSYLMFEVENFAVDYVEHQMEQTYDVDELIQELKSKPTSDHWMKAITLSETKVDHELGVDNDDDLPLTYAYEPEQLFIDEISGEPMPVWAPPTPPQDDGDLYIDQTQSFVYEPIPMSESQLPPVYVRKGHKRHRIDPLARKQKMRARDDLPSVPRSLFDCPQTIAQRMERDARLLKQQGLLKPVLKIQLQQQQQPQVMTPAANAAGAMIGRPIAEQTAQHEIAEWLIYEDWALLQALQTLQEMPLNLLTSSPGHLPNWDLVADIVNGVSRTYRSPKQCRQRYENVILPREEGRVTYDASPRKLKKATKGLYKTKYNRSMRTQQLYVQDNSKASSTLYTLRFDAIKMIAAARTPAARPQPTGAVGAGLKNTKHIAVLAESGINYDQPLSPGHVAAMRAERIAKEIKEKKSASTAAGNVEVQQTAQPTQPQQVALQRPSVAVPSSTLQQLIIQPTQAAAGHVILQSGQQLISAATGQHVLASVDGRPQQMTIVQGSAGTPAAQAGATGTLPTASLLSANLVKSSSATVAAAGGTSVVTAVSLARNLSMAGIIVSQTIGQTIATINKGQTVVAPASFLQAQGAAQVRGALRNVAPFALKDASNVSIVSQSTTGVLSDAAIARVISTTTSLTPAQLVVTQQKPGIVGVSTVPQGSIQQQLIGLSVAPSASSLTAAAASKGLTTMQPVQVMRHKQVLQQLRPTMPAQQISQQVSTVTGSMAAVVASGQKTVTVTAPVVAGLSHTLQLKPGAFQEILKRTQQQQQVAKTVPGTGNVAIQQIQATKAQIVEGMQLQQVPSSVSAQTVATLMKAVSSTATGTVVSSVTLPTAPGAGNTINILSQQKLLAAGKIQPQQIRQLQMQKRPAAVQIQNPQKMTTIQQVTKMPTSGGSSVIFRPQQVVVQQMSTQQFAKSTQQGTQPPRIQQFISSGSSSAAAAVLATQIVGQTGSASTVAVANTPTLPKTLSVTITTATVPAGAVATVAMSSPAGSASAAIQNAGVPMTATVKLLPASVTTLVKPIKDPPSTSTLAMTSRAAGGTPAVVGVQQVLIRPGAAVAMSVPSGVAASPHITLAAVTSARPGTVGGTGTQNVTVAAASTPASTASTSSIVPVSPGVQQAVQEVVQQAQAQARQQPMAAINFVAVTSSTTLQSPGQTLSSPAGTIIGSTQVGTVQQQQGSTDSAAGSNKSSPYVMRLRNQKS